MPRCPLDNTELQDVNLIGISFHKCPTCEGLLIHKDAILLMKKHVAKKFPDQKITDPKYRVKSNRAVCPFDGEPFVEFSQEGVMVDICPECNCVWLDKGELDKIKDQEGEFVPEDWFTFFIGLLLGNPLPGFRGKI